MTGQISYQEFLEMDVLEQIELLLTEGLLQAQSKTSTDRSFLYQLAGFYVKITYTEPDEEFKSIQIFERAADAFVQFQAPSGIIDPACRVQSIFGK